MNILKSFFIKPFTVKGALWGTIDLIVKLAAVVLWVYLLTILGSLLTLSLRIDYNRMTQLWWCAYCFVMFFGASLLFYIVCFVRDYNDEEAETAE